MRGIWSDYSLYCDKASFTAHRDGMRSNQVTYTFKPSWESFINSRLKNIEINGALWISRLRCRGRHLSTSLPSKLSHSRISSQCNIYITGKEEMTHNNRKKRRFMCTYPHVSHIKTNKQNVNVTWYYTWQQVKLYEQLHSSSVFIFLTSCRTLRKTSNFGWGD